MPTTSFFAHFESTFQICDDRSQGVLFEQMTSSAMCYDIIYHPFPLFLIFEDVGAFDSPAIIGSTSPHPHQGAIAQNNCVVQ